MSKSNALIVFRVDTRGAIGRRSLERSLVLAEAHTRRGGRTLFALGADEKAARAILAARGVRIKILSNIIGSAADAEELLAAAKFDGASSIVIDGKVFDQEYLARISSSIFTAVVEDDGERALPVQLIINSSFSADERFYTCKPDSRLLLGPSFAPVSSDIARWPAPERPANTNIERIFVSSEDDHASARVLDALPACKGTTVVTVLGSRTCKMLDAAARSACARGYIIEQISRNSITDALLLADVAIVTKESFQGLIGYLGIPTLCIGNSEDDARETHRMAEERANVHMAPMTTMRNAELERTIEGFLLDQAQRHRIS